MNREHAASMGHNICVIAFSGSYDKRVAAQYDLHPRIEHGALTLFPVNHYYSMYWAHRLSVPGELDLPADTCAVMPRERVLVTLVRAISGLVSPRFALMMTDYFGGAGTQWAYLFEGDKLVADTMISAALAALGVQRTGGDDEFDTIGLSRFRYNPDYLQRYAELCEEAGL